MPMLCLGIRLSPYDLRLVEAELGRGSDGGRLDLAITAAPPCHQRAADSQQRRSVLSDHVQRRQRPYGHQVEATRPSCPGLCARVDNVNVGDFHAALRPAPGRRICARRSRGARHRAPAEAIASGRPGTPAPEPTSTAWRACTTGSSSRAASESAKWSSIARSGLWTVVAQADPRPAVAAAPPALRARPPSAHSAPRARRSACAGRSRAAYAWTPPPRSGRPRLPRRPAVRQRCPFALDVGCVAPAHCLEPLGGMTVNTRVDRLLEQRQDIPDQRRSPGHPLVVRAAAVVVGPVQTGGGEAAPSATETGPRGGRACAP